MNEPLPASTRVFRHVGTRPIRPDGVDKVTGRANFGADIAWPGMLHGATLGSPHAHARIVSIDTTAAEALPGVRAVIDGRDLERVQTMVAIGEGSVNVGDVVDNCLAYKKVLYHGHVVAAVAATTPAIAQQALQLIDVVYEPLAAVLDLEAAIAPGASILHPERFAGQPSANIASRMSLTRGNAEEGFAGADVVLERTFVTSMVHQGYIEPHACAARVGEDGQVVLWTSTQGPFLVRDVCAAALQIDASRIKVIPSEIGGGFGGKIPVYLEPLAVALARKSGRAVKMVMTREQVFRATGPTSGASIRVKLGAKADGALVAADVTLYYEAGAYPGSPVGPAAMTCIAPYRIANFDIEGFDVVLNRPRVAAYRAPGAPAASFAVESMVDEMARALRIDPLELRIKNAVAEGDTTPYGTTLSAIGLRECLAAAGAHPHYRAPLGPNQGRGLACGFWFNGSLSSSATVHLQADGSASVMTGNPDIGGSRASMALMVAEELGIPVERVRPSVGDTDSVGFTDVTGGSRTTFATGMAVIEASRKVVAELCRRAAHMWGVGDECVSWKDGIAWCADVGGAAKQLTLSDIGAQFHHTGGPVGASFSLQAPMAAPSFAVHICDVEVDRETGASKVVRYTAVQDAGKAIHPAYVEGQMQGGAAQGIGWALNEEYIFDREGRMENAGFLDYRMPVASDLPMIDTVIVEVPNPSHPYGVRGVGEVPIVPPLAAVANAMRAATGVRFTRLPMSPPAVLAALDKLA
jgi:CO/xanthine dehydrogenase Mo-binding subunit